MPRPNIPKLKFLAYQHNTAHESSIIGDCTQIHGLTVKIAITSPLHEGNDLVVMAQEDRRPLICSGGMNCGEMALPAHEIRLRPAPSPSSHTTISR